MHVRLLHCRKERGRAGECHSGMGGDARAPYHKRPLCFTSTAVRLDKYPFCRERHPIPPLMEGGLTHRRAERCLHHRLIPLYSLRIPHTTK